MTVKSFIIFVFLVTLLSGCAEIKKEVAIPPTEAKIDYKLLQKSDYVDIVYENKKFSYISYLKEKLPSINKEPQWCQEENPQFPTKRGIWIWRFNEVFGKEETIISNLKKLRIDRVYIQVDDNLEKFIPFLKLAKSNNIEVFAVDGSPSYVIDPQALLKRIQGVIRFNENKNYFKGFQIDVEPYLLKDFNIHETSYLKKYVNLIEKIKQLTKNKLQFSVVMPFWFDSVFYKGQPISSYVINLADEVVIMSYRTNLNEILKISMPELCYASKVNKPIYLALEINPLSSEEHFLVKKEEILKNLTDIDGTFYLSRLPLSGLKFFNSYKVKPENLTFYKNPEVWKILSHKVKMKSFAGWVIENFEGLEKQ